MKKKLLNSMRVLLVAAGLCVGANSAWADATWTVDYTGKSNGWITLTNSGEGTDYTGSENLVVANYGTVTLAYNAGTNASKLVFEAGDLKFAGAAPRYTITLPEGKTFKAGDKLQIIGIGAKSGNPACLYVADGVLKTPLIPSKNTDVSASSAPFDSDEMEIPSGFLASNSIVLRIAGSSETGPDGVTTCGGAIKLQKVIYTAVTSPTINTQPVSASYATGATATALSVTATASSGELSYQWYSNTTESTAGATELTGQTSSTYTPSTASAGTTYYYCAVTDDSGTTNTDIVSVVVADGSAPTKPSITGTPVSNVDNGASVTLTASSTGSPAPSYQWYSNTTSTATVDAEHLISGATSATYSPSTASAGTTYYYVVATNSEGTATSDAVSVTVNARTGCDLTKLVFSNSFDAFIVGTSATAYYMSGDDAPTISSATISDGATYNVDGTTLTVTAEDGTTKDYTITLTSITPYTGEGELTFDGTETWVKTGYKFDKDKGWSFQKNADDGRILLGKTRLYFFVGPTNKVTFTSGTGGARNVFVYVNGELKNSITSTPASGSTVDIPCNQDANNMIAIVSNQTGGDGGFTKATLPDFISSLKVQYLDDETLIKEETLTTPSNRVGDTYTVPFRMYVTNDAGTALYYTANETSNPHYGKPVTLTANTVLTRDLTEYDLGGGTIELMEDFDGSTAQNGYIRASNCSTYENTAYTSTVDLPAGVYKFISRGYSRGRGSSVKVGETTIFETSEFSGSWNNITKNDVLVPAAGKLTFVAGGSGSYDPIDILIAIRQPAPATVSATIGSTGYATFASAYPLNVTDKGAYKVTGVSGGSVVIESVTGNVAAGTGLLLKGDEGSVTIPVTASGATVTSNLLTGCIEDTEITTPDVTKWVIVDEGGVAKFKNLGGTYTGSKVTIPAGKAYLTYDAGSGAKMLQIIDSETSGISNASLRMDNGERTNDKLIFNLNGQRITAPQKGINIINGRKFVVK